MSLFKPKKPALGSLWRHYRTGGIYRVVDLCLFVTRDADKWMVVYESVDGPAEDGIDTFCRTYEDFFQLVLGDGKVETYRFEEVIPDGLTVSPNGSP